MAFLMFWKYNFFLLKFVLYELQTNPTFCVVAGIYPYYNSVFCFVFVTGSKPEVGEEHKREGTAKMYRETIHSTRLPPFALSLYLWEAFAVNVSFKYV